MVYHIPLMVEAICASGIPPRDIRRDVCIERFRPSARACEAAAVPVRDVRNAPPGRPAPARNGSAPTPTSAAPASTGALAQNPPMPPTPDRSAAARRWTLASAILGSSMAFMDGTVVNVALPAIQRGLDASGADAQWVVEAYALFLSALLLVGGALGDRFGRKRVYVIGVAMFVATSAACAAADSTGLLIAARALQGVGAALLVPGSLALLGAGFPAAERGRAIGTWSACSGIAAAIGPVVGGALVDHASWRWAFLLNLPIGALLLFVTLPRVPESRGDDAPGPLDLAGAASATLGLAGVVFALIEAPARGWGAPAVFASGLAGIAALAAFAWIEARGHAPMMPPALFRQRDFAGANLLTLLLYAALGGSLYFVPLNLIQVQGWTATAAGAALLPFIVIMAGLSRAAGALADRLGARIPLVAGPAIAAAGFAAFALPGVGASYWSGFFPAICILGLGMTVTITPLTTTVMNAVGEALAGTASGINNAVSRTAGLLAIAALGAVLAGVFDVQLHSRLAAAKLPADVAAQVEAQRHKLAAIAPPEGAAPAAAQQVKQAVGGAFVDGFRAVMLVSAGLALASAVSAWFMIAGRAPQRKGGTHG